MLPRAAKTSGGCPLLREGFRMHTTSLFDADKNLGYPRVHTTLLGKNRISPAGGWMVTSRLGDRAVITHAQRHARFRSGRVGQGRRGTTIAGGSSQGITERQRQIDK